MKRLLLPLLASIALPTVIDAHPNYQGSEIKKQYGLKINSSSNKKKLTKSEQEALKSLCKIGLNADGGIWSNDDINAAIASIKFGEHWPDYASATAYKTCNWGGYLD
tara:strand:- start:260 stop:580 length:321 start_codon:yes stop_codon:yes gene_type:complete